MRRRGPPPPDQGTVEVLERWRPHRAPAEHDGTRRAAGVVVAVTLAGVVVASSWLEGSTDGSGRSEEPAASAAPLVSGTTQPPARFDQPVGHRLVVLTLTGLLVLEPDTGSYSELELGSVRSFSTSPAVAPMGPSEVAVLFTDRSVGLVDLEERSVRRIDEDVQAVFESTEPGTIWVRRQLDDESWELIRIDSSGRALTESSGHLGPSPPSVAGGRPVAAGAAGPVSLATPDGRHLVEVHEQRSTLHSFDVRVEDVATGRTRWLRDLDNPPVLAPGGRHLLVGEPITNRLTAYDVATFEAQTVQAPDSSGVTLDWENMVVLPRDQGGR